MKLLLSSSLLLFLITSMIWIVDSYGSDESQASLLSGPVREEDEIFSSDHITIGEAVKITGKLVSLTKEKLTISISIFDGTDRTASNWEILNVAPSKAFTLAAGEIKEFSIEVKALREGIYRLQPVFRIADLGDKYGVGQRITVFPGLITDYRLEVDGHKFNITYILHKPYNLDKIWLDKQQKTLFIEISSEEAVKEQKRLSVWIPTKLIQNIVSEQDNFVQPLELYINGTSTKYAESALITEEYGVYTIGILPATYLTIEMKGTHVIPEFPFNMLSSLVIALIGMLILLRMPTNRYLPNI
ncbi:MAG: hypothetical protein QXN83_09655 [Nitrososphaerales archaeon]